MFIFLAICNSMLLFLVVIKHCSPTAVLVTRNKKPGINQLEVRIAEDEMVMTNQPHGLSDNYLQYWGREVDNLNEYNDRWSLLVERRHLMPPEQSKIVIAGRQNRQTAVGISGITQLTYDFADKVARAEGKDRILRKRRGESAAQYNRRKQLLIQQRAKMRRRFGPAGNHVIARFARNNRERRLLARQRHLERDLRNNAFGKFKRQHARYRGIYNNVGPTLHALDDSYFEFVRKFGDPETNFLAVRKNEIYDLQVGRQRQRGDLIHRLKPKAQKLRGHLYTEAMDYKLAETLEGIYGPANIYEGNSPLVEPLERTSHAAKNDLVEAMAANAMESANHRHFTVSEDFRGYHFSVDGKTTKLQHKPSLRHPIYREYMRRVVEPKEAVKNMIQEGHWKYEDVPGFKRTRMQKRLQEIALDEMYPAMRQRDHKNTKAGMIIAKHDKHRAAKRRRNNTSAAGPARSGLPLRVNKKAEHRRQQRRQLRTIRPQIPSGSVRI